MVTQKRYYEDAYETIFEASVLSCQKGKKFYEIVLDETAFYPEGGGQPSDIGELGGVKVLEVHEKNDEIVHFCDGPLEVGQKVIGKLDWDRRFDFMQQHSGEHILSGLIHQYYGYDNVGFHLGSETVTIDFNGMIGEDGLRNLEQKANEAVWKNVETQITFPDQETLHHLEYRSKKELNGAVRIVAFPGADICACCGTHVHRTGEIGLIKILSSQKFHDGVRLELVCGNRALHYVQDVFAQNHAISILLSAKERQTAAVVQKLHDEFAQAKFRIGKMEETAFAQKAQELKGKGNVVIFEDGLTSEGVRKMASAILETCGGWCAVFSGEDGQGYKYCVGTPQGDMRQLVKEMNEKLNGRGGGKPDFLQGSLQAKRKEIENFWDER